MTLGNGSAGGSRTGSVVAVAMLPPFLVLYQQFSERRRAFNPW
jgi:hypothetical protein